MLVSLWEKAIRINYDKNLTQHGKDVALANLMTTMEQHYQIPMLRNPEWEARNPEVIVVYRAISDLRKL
jgi:hypothetical protein